MIGKEPDVIRRFTTGSCHYVFDVATKRGGTLVVRIAASCHRHSLHGAVYWNRLLRPLGIPLPELILADVEGTRSRFPFIVLERFPGTDLGHVYPSLSVAQKRAIVMRIVEAQRMAATLPEANGFGFASSYEKARHRSWLDVIRSSLNRSARWILDAGAVDPCVVESVRGAAVRYESYFASVRPRPFLDDTTTKNVIVHDGRLSGIVDVDEVCFGDALFTPALTKMSLLSSGYDTDYIDMWCEALDLDELQRRVLTFYTAVFCVNFLGELGQRFNSDAPVSVDPEKVGRLTSILGILLRDC